LTHAIVLIEADRGVIGTLGGELAAVFSRHDLEALFSIGE
jgi:hypothetical protein